MPRNSTTQTGPNAAEANDDPLLRSARREAAVVFALWLAAIVYTVGYSYTFGYNRPADSISYIYGVPDWVMWGVVLPWGVSTVAAIGFAWFFMTDDRLGDESARPDGFDVPPDARGES